MFALFVICSRLSDNICMLTFLFAGVTHLTVAAGLGSGSRLRISLITITPRLLQGLDLCLQYGDLPGLLGDLVA